MLFDNPDLDAVARGLVLAAAAIAWVALLARIVGLRSFSKMTSFDLVMTLAVGSLAAAAAMTDDWHKLVQALVAMVGLFAVQWTVARLRKHSRAADRAIQNTPVLLVENGKIDERAMHETRVTHSDLFAKLREANVAGLADVRAVVLETTGDVSVLHGAELDQRLLEGVRRIGG